MILKNNAKRLITINGALVEGQRVTSYQIRPGNNPSVDVPDELCDNEFVKALLDDGSLIKVGESAKPVVETTETETTGDYDAMNKTDLTAFAEAQGIEVKSAWSKAEIIAEIEKLEAE